ncbi:MAG: response regulator transcription factor [Thiothrix sp.]|nr:MAG: response regulator transcription factor [Thiothrix sp.]
MLESLSLTPNHILIVDDEPAIRSLVKRYFEKQGMVVHCAASGDEMHAVLNTEAIDIVFLDVHLPGKDGFVLLDEIKTEHQAGVIMLTVENDLDARLHGLNGGADDYMPKPFAMSELHARSNAVLRRLGRFKQPPKLETNSYRFAGYALDCKLREVRNRQHELIDLSPAEIDLLLVFVKHPQTVLNRDYLMQQTRGRDAAPFDRTIDVRVGQLRKKLPIEDEQSLFKTVRGGGYMLTQTVEKVRSPPLSG